VEARSDAFGEGDPAPKPTQRSAGTLSGGNFGTMPYAEQSKAWGRSPSRPERDLLRVEAENLSRVVVRPKRAELTCGAKLRVTTDGPLVVKLAGCGRTASFG
jgi:hypothetical protein